jgi:hypothetical protein
VGAGFLVGWNARSLSSYGESAWKVNCLAVLPLPGLLLAFLGGFHPFPLELALESRKALVADSHNVHAAESEGHATAPGYKPG